MNYADQYANPYSVAQAPANARTEFYQKTYVHLALALGALVILDGILLSIPAVVSTTMGIFAANKFAGLIAVGAFMAVSWVAQRWAESDTSRGMQYAGLALYVVAQALIFLPLLIVVQVLMGAPQLFVQAGIITAAMFGGLTFVAFTTKKDFSFLGGMLKISGFVLIGLIAASFFTQMDLGLIIATVGILLASGSILYQTSGMIHHYRTDQYVAASLGLFASVALLFFYVLRILVALQSND